MNEAVAEKPNRERAYRSMCRTIYLVNIYLSEQVDESVRDWNNASPVNGKEELCDFLKTRIQHF
jgi:hypothetical protein